MYPNNNNTVKPSCDKFARESGATYFSVVWSVKYTECTVIQDFYYFSLYRDFRLLGYPSYGDFAVPITHVI